jgi:aminopeptidase N
VPGPKFEGGESQEVFFQDVLQAHETAHQWWGNRVTAASYRDYWLMEALANYSALL